MKRDALKIFKVLATIAAEKKRIYYSDLVREAGVDWWENPHSPALSEALTEIVAFCFKNQLPPITILVHYKNPKESSYGDCFFRVLGKFYGNEYRKRLKTNPKFEIQEITSVWENSTKYLVYEAIDILPA